MFKCISVFFGWEGTKHSQSFEMLVMTGLWGCQWLLGIVEMLNANGNWALSVNEYWTMGWMVLNVCCRRNAKGYWAWWMVLIIGFRRMSWILGFG
jgi:hypothetical protein